MNDTTGAITYPPPERYEFTFVVPPDAKDARIAQLEEQYEASDRFAAFNHERAERGQDRIAELEAALREIRERIEKHIDRLSIQDVLIMRAVDAVLPRPPEGDMRITHEELPA